MCICSKFARFLCKTGRRNSQSICLTGCIDICKNQMIRVRKSLCKFMEESFCSRISMWLEDTPYLIVWVVLCSLQSSGNLCRMMCIIIDNSYTVKCSLVFETTVCSAERKNSFFNCFHWNLKQFSSSNRCKCI